MKFDVILEFYQYDIWVINLYHKGLHKSKFNIFCKKNQKLALFKSTFKNVFLEFFVDMA